MYTYLLVATNDIIPVISDNLSHTSQHINDSDDFDLEVIVSLPRYLVIHNFITMRVDNQIEVQCRSLSSEDNLQSNTIRNSICKEESLYG